MGFPSRTARKFQNRSVGRFQIRSAARCRTKTARTCPSRSVTQSTRKFRSGSAELCLRKFVTAALALALALDLVGILTLGTEELEIMTTTTEAQTLAGVLTRELGTFLALVMTTLRSKSSLRSRSTSSLVTLSTSADTALSLVNII